MLAVTLTLVACPAPQDDYVRPVDPVLTGRIPDVHAAREALGTTALARFLSDEEVVAFYREATGRARTTPRETIACLLRGAFCNEVLGPRAAEYAAIERSALDPARRAVPPFGDRNR